MNRKEALKEIIEKVNDTLKKTQLLLDTSFSVKFEDANFEFNSRKFGKLHCRISQKM